jgi:hypothetical protein
MAHLRAAERSFRLSGEVENLAAVQSNEAEALNLAGNGECKIPS